MAYAQPASNLAEIVRPFAWIALAAFLAGVVLGLAAHLGRLAGERDSGPTLRPSIVHDAPQDAGWNLRKSI